MLMFLCGMAAYDMHGMVEFAEPVPFRLTRNLQTFFTPFGVEGLFISSMCAAAQAVVAPKVSFFPSLDCLAIAFVSFCGGGFLKVNGF